MIEKNIANTMDDIAIRKFVSRAAKKKTNETFVYSLFYSSLLYLTHEDLSSSIDDEIVLVVEGVAGTTMKVDEIMVSRFSLNYSNINKRNLIQLDSTTFRKEIN